MTEKPAVRESRVAVLVDCDNVQPVILDHALRFVAQFGRVVVRRGYGNHATLAGKAWQEALVQQAFTPCLQYQYASGKNTADIALALDALELLFDETVDVFCLVTSDSDFAYLCRKLRERGAIMCIVGEEKTPQALRNASDYFSEWEPAEEYLSSGAPVIPAPAKSATQTTANPAKANVKQRPMSVIRAVKMLAANTDDGRVHLGELGSYLRRTDPSFSPEAYGHSGLLQMLRTYDANKLVLKQDAGTSWTVRLAQPVQGESNGAEQVRQ